MKILETNPNGSPHPNSLMPRTWYLISTLHIPPSPVLSHCPEHAVAFVPCLHAFQMGISFINFLVYSVHLFSLTLSFHTLFGISSQNFQTSFYFNSCFFYSHIYFTEKKKKKILLENKTTILIGGGQWSPLLLNFPGAILEPLHIISALLLPDLSFRAPSPLHSSPNSLQLGCVPLLTLHQGPERPPDSSILLHKLPECLFNGT